MGYSLLGRVVGEGDALFDVAAQALDGSLEQGLFLVGEVDEGVDGPLDAVGLRTCQHDGTVLTEGITHAKLNGDGEEVDTGLLADLLAARNAGEVDVAGLDEALDARGGLEDLLGEPKRQLVPGGAEKLPSPRAYL